MKGHVRLTLHRLAPPPSTCHHTKDPDKLQICGDFMLYESNDAPSIQLVTRQTVTVKGRMASGSWEEQSPTALYQGQARLAGLTGGG